MIQIMQDIKCTIIRPAELDAGQIGRWSEIQGSDPCFASPFFCPGFTLAAAAVRTNVYVAVLERAGQIVGFLPFERYPLGVARPVAYVVSDYQGVVMLPGVQWDAPKLMRSCGLSVFEFNHLLAGQVPFQPYHQKVGISPLIDLSQGYEAYRLERRQAGSEQLLDLERMARKVERQVGFLRLEAHVSGSAALGMLTAWKTGHDMQKGYRNILAVPWVYRLVERLHQTRGDQFAGMLSVLYAGDQPLAAHMGLRSRSTLHWWMPAFNRQFGKYSPGLLLLLMMAQSAPQLGLTTIDLGKGPMEYKDRLMNGSIPLAEGRIALSGMAAALFEGARKSKRWVDGIRRYRPWRKGAVGVQ